jgi:hypothetical protein
MTPVWLVSFVKVICRVLGPSTVVAMVILILLIDDDDGHIRAIGGRR